MRSSQSFQFKTGSKSDHAELSATSWPGALSDPSTFLHAMDLDQRTVTFVPTSRAALGRAAFLDGREDFSVGAAWQVDLDDVIQFRPPAEFPGRYIFHVSFCGSTFLARLIDLPGRSLVLREPNCLVNLSDWKARQDLAGAGDAEIGPALQWSRAMLRRRWKPNEPTVIKPSSWVNNLAESLTVQPATILPLFVTMAPADFLCAVLRGGRDRLAYTARLASHLASAETDGEDLLAAAIEQNRDPLLSALHLAGLALHLQLRLFERIMKRGGWSEDHVLDFQDVTNLPLDSGLQASRALQLGLESAEIEKSVIANVDHHAKAFDHEFSLKQRQIEDQTVFDHHRSAIETVTGWLERGLPALAFSGR